MPSGTTPLSQALITARRQEQEQVNRAVARAQDAINSGLFESPWDWRRFGLNVMKDIARSNSQRYAPGIFPPFAPVPANYMPRQYPPGVLVPASAGVAAGLVSRVEPSGGSAGPLYAGSTRAPRAGREFNPIYRGSAAGASGRSQEAMSGTSGRAGSGAGSGLIGAPFTRPIPPSGAPSAAATPEGGGVTPPTATGPNGTKGFTGRKECASTAPGIDILGPQTGTPPTPAPELTIPPQWIDAPVLPASAAPHGLSGAFPTGCTPSAGVPTTMATEAAANAGSGTNWWWLLLALGVGAWLASGDDDAPRGRAKR